MHAIEDPGQLLEAVGPILGFPPVESVVIVAVQRGAIGCVMRLDLREALIEGALEQLAELTERSNAGGAVAVIVSEESAVCPVCADEFRELARDLAEALGRHGVRLMDVLVVDRLAAEGRWHCVDQCGVSGVLRDPALSPLAAAAVVAGRRLYKDRDELKASVAVDDEHATAVARLLPRGGSGGAGGVAGAVASAVAAMHRLAEGKGVSDAVLASVGATLSDVRVRDCLFTASDSDLASSAEALWVLLARVLPAPLRAEALTLLAVSAYARGEGPLAGVAIEAALAEAPAHRMAGLLDTALQGGIRPEDIRELLSGISSAVTA